MDVSRAGLRRGLEGQVRTCECMCIYTIYVNVSVDCVYWMLNMPMVLHDEKINDIAIF